MIYRKDVAIRKLHYGHCILLCLSAIIFCWALVLLWPADAIVEQCDSYLWIVYLSGSFIVSLINMKAYRLSAFLESNHNNERPKGFTHGKALMYAFNMVFATLVLLIICHTVDPPTLLRKVRDPYRPRLDFHICKTGT